MSQRRDQDILADLEGRTVYYCFRRYMPAEMVRFLKPLIIQSTSIEELCHQDGLVVLKCSY